MTAYFTMTDEPAPQSVGGAPEIDRLAAALAPFHLHGKTAGAMVARLDLYLDHLATIPVDDWNRWSAGTSRWIVLRCGPLATPQLPHLWPWPMSLADWITHGYPLAVRCRAAFLALDGADRRVARQRWGALRGSEGDMDFGPLWRYGTPVDATRRLDERAEQLQVRRMHRAA